MFRLTAEQFVQIRKNLELEQFEDAMVVHLKGYVPRSWEVLGEPGIRQCIRLGVERARVYGVNNPGLLRFYVELMFLFGSLFDTDPLYPWAGQILQDPAIESQAARIGRLYQATLVYLDAVGGTGPEVEVVILRNLQRVLSADFSQADPRFEQQLLDAVVSIQPRRCAHLGNPPLRQLLQRARAAAAGHHVATDAGIIVFTVLMFAIGHGFTEDPTFPRIGDRLRSLSIKDPSQRASHLRRRTQLFVSQALAYFER